MRASMPNPGLISPYTADVGSRMLAAYVLEVRR